MTRLEEIRKRHESTTPGYWDDKVTAVYVDGTAVRVCGDFSNFSSDAAFVANAHQDIPFLLTEVERLERSRDKYDRRAKDWRNIAAEFQVAHTHLQDELQYAFDGATVLAKEGEKFAAKIASLTAERNALARYIFSLDIDEDVCKKNPNCGEPDHTNVGCIACIIKTLGQADG